MAITVQTLLTEKAKKFGASETTPEFQEKFLDALNYTLDDIQNEVGVSVNRTDDIGGSINLDEQSYRGTISFGIDYYLSVMMEYRIQSLKDLKEMFTAKLKHARRIYASGQTTVGIRGDMTT